MASSYGDREIEALTGFWVLQNDKYELTVPKSWPNLAMSSWAVGRFSLNKIEVSGSNTGIDLTRLTRPTFGSHAVAKDQLLGASLIA